jgi:hypothetical protein
MSKDIDFPNLRAEDWKQTSEIDPVYNCIAYAAGRTDVFWWPDSFAPPLDDYWPANVSREETIEAFVELYGTFHYEPCSDDSLESGYEKVVIYAIGTIPTHAAKQLSDGSWTSKLGTYEDIQHRDLECLNGPCYGQPVRFMRRPIASP